MSIQLDHPSCCKLSCHLQFHSPHISVQETETTPVCFHCFEERLASCLEFLWRMKHDAKFHSLSSISLRFSSCLTCKHPIQYRFDWQCQVQCSEPGWLVRQGVGSSPTPASMSSQVSACYEIKFSGRYRGFACVLFKLWQAITPGSGASGVWWEPPVWITDGRGQRSYRKNRVSAPCQSNPPAKLGSINI